MKHCFFFCCLLSGFFHTLTAQVPYTAFEKQINAEGFSIEPFARTSQIQQTWATLVAANANIGSLGDADMLFLRMDDQGNVLADRQIGEDNYHDVAKEVVWYDAHYYVTGYTRNTDTASNPTFTSFIIKLDSNLNMVWQKNFIFPAPAEIYSNSIVVSQNNTLLLSGQLYDGSEWNSFILRTDTAGTLQWFKQYSSPSSLIPMHMMCVREMGNGDLMVCGASSAGFQVILPFACRFDASGNFIWGKRFNTPPNFQNSDFFYIQEITPGNVLLAGKTDFAGAGNMDYFVVSVNDSGSVNWAKTYGKDQIDWPFGAVYDAQAGELVMTGHSGSFTPSSGTMRGLVMQINPVSGALVGSRLVGDTLASYPLSLYNTNRFGNSARFITGTMGSPADKIYVAGTDNTLQSWCHTINVNPIETNITSATSSFTVNVTVPNPVMNGNKLSDTNFNSTSLLCSSPLAVAEQQQEAGTLRISPNPVIAGAAGGGITIALPEGFIPEQVEIFDLTGRRMMQQAWSGNVIILPESMGSGLYFLCVKNDTARLQTRFVVQH